MFSPEIQTRVNWSGGLLFIAILIWFLSDYLSVIPSPQWLTGVISELLVLSLAGIWISYVVERQTAKATREGIDKRFEILSSTLHAKIQKVYYDEEPRVSNRRGPEYQTDLNLELEKTRGEVRIMAIAAREFLHDGHGIGFIYHTLQLLLQQTNPQVRILLLHPWCEQAVSRGLHEDKVHSQISNYQDTRLFQEIMRSCEVLAKWMESSECVQARLYKVMPACFLVFVNDVVFIEQYHFGAGGRASGKVPVLKVSKGGNIYTQLDGHFEHIWEISAPYQITSEFVQDLKHPDENYLEQFIGSLRFLRPDLFDTSNS